MHRFAVVFVCLLCAPLVGCGFLDTDLQLSDEEWEESFGLGGMGISGSGHGWGCGGGRGLVSRRAVRGKASGVGSSGGRSILEFDPFYISGRRGRAAGGEGQPDAELVGVEAAPRPVDWVGHFDEVSSERQNVLLAAWIEGQLDEPGAGNDGD